MGRHSSAEQAPFLRSLVGWLLPWILVAAVAVVAVVVGVNALGQDELAAQPPPPERRGSAADPSPTATTTPSGTRLPTPTPTRNPKPKPKPTRTPKPELITEGVTVQVLDAAGSGVATDAVATRLADLGFEIAVVGTASRLYDGTTVFWSSAESEDAGRALAERFGWVGEPKPPNLSETVDLHVVVGRDER